MLLIAVVLGYVYCGKITEALISKTIDAFETQVLADLPEGYDSEEVKQKFDSFKEAINRQVKEQSLDQAELQRLSTKVQEALVDKEIDREELDEIFKLIDEIIQTE
jgi:hypothetical protein